MTAMHGRVAATACQCLGSIGCIAYTSMPRVRSVEVEHSTGSTNRIVKHASRRKGEDCYMFDMSRIPLVSMIVLSFSSFFSFLEFQIS